MRFNKLCIDCRASKTWNSRSSLCEKCFDKRMHEKVKEKSNDREYERKDIIHS